MKTTEKNYSEKEQEKLKESGTPSLKLGSIGSVRPQKSMVRVKSLKPRRVAISRKISIRSTSAE